MKKEIESKLKTVDEWFNEEITIKNVSNFLKFMASEFEEHSEQFLDIRKKILRKNRAVLSILISFSREIDKTNEDLVKLMKKFIQTIIDNPKWFKK